MGEAVDRRVRKTRRILKDGLAKLMREKPVNEISVRELSELCDINRGTFYLHYRDVFDMVEKVQEEFYGDFCEVLERHDIQEVDDIGPMLDDIFVFFGDNREMCSAILGRYGSTAYTQHIVETVKTKCMVMTQDYGIDDMRRFERGYWFMVSGAVGVIQAWLQSDDPEPPGEVSSLITALIFDGVKSFSPPVLFKRRKK